MTEDYFLGTYERKLDPKNRVTIPAKWKPALTNYRELYLFQARGVDFISVLSKPHLENNQFKISPLECNSTNIGQFIAQFTPAYGPTEIKLNLSKQPYRLTIPQKAPFLNNLREDRKVTLVGGKDYFALFHGTIDELINYS